MLTTAGPIARSLRGSHPSGSLEAGRAADAEAALQYLESHQDPWEDCRLDHSLSGQTAGPPGDEDPAGL